MNDYNILTTEARASIASLDANWCTSATFSRQQIGVIVSEVESLRGDAFKEVKRACEEAGVTHLTPQTLRRGFYAVALTNSLVDKTCPIEVNGKFTSDGNAVDLAGALGSTLGKLDKESFYKSSVKELANFVAKSVENIVKVMVDGVKEKATAELVFDEDEDGKKAEYPSKLVLKIVQPLGKTISKQDQNDQAVDNVIKKIDDISEAKLVELAAMLERKYPEIVARAQDLVLSEKEAS